MGEHDKKLVNALKELHLRNGTLLDDGRDLYKILNLNFKDVRELLRDKQDEVIEKAFQIEVNSLYIDRAGNFYNENKACELIFAYYILANRKTRTQYHNKTNYREGWRSLARWKSIFLTECETKEQKDKYGVRIKCAAVSVFQALCGFSLTAFTAGAATPAVVAVCGTLGGGYQAAGLHIFQKLIEEDSVLNGLDDKILDRTHVVGFVTGLVTGGLSVCIRAGIIGIGAMAIPKAKVTHEQLMSVCLASGVTGGTVSSLAYDAEKIFFDGQTMTWNEVVGHAVGHAVTGAVESASKNTAWALAKMAFKKKDESVSKNLEKKEVYLQ